MNTTRTNIRKSITRLDRLVEIELSKNTVPHNSSNNWTTDELIAVLGEPARIPNASGGTSLLWNSQPIVKSIHYQLQ